MNDSWIVRKKTNQIFVGDVGVGGDNPISIQSMTNTNTADTTTLLILLLCSWGLEQGERQ